MECLDCKIELNEQYAHGITIDMCPSCKSIWFDPGELEVLKHHPDQELLSKLDQSAEFKQKSEIVAPCPRCNTKTLNMGKVRGYEAGRCSSCHGVWVNPRKMKSKRSCRESTSDGFLFDIVWVALEVMSGIFDV